jgi:hypothetical protein
VPDLTPDHPEARTIEVLHRAAVSSGRATYRDPVTGFDVMTADTLSARGSCCGSGCRHCPYPEAEQRRAGRPSVGEPPGRWGR